MSRNSGRHLTYEERCQISSYICNGYSQREVALLIGRHQSVISREITRNSSQFQYEEVQAQKNAELRRSVASSRPRKMGPDMVQRVKHYLNESDASPEQISGRLKKTDSIKISHESIYRLIWSDKARGGTLYEHWTAPLRLEGFQESCMTG